MTIDPKVSDLGTDDLSRLAAVGSAVTVIGPVRHVSAPFPPDGAAINTEMFLLALMYENRTNPRTSPYEERLFFPVNPEEFAWSQTRPAGAYDILNGPQATQLGNMQLRTFQLSGFFPELWEPDYCHSIPAPHAVTVWDTTTNRNEVKLFPDRSPQASRAWLDRVMRAGFPLKLICLPLRTGLAGTIPAIFPTTKVVITSLNTSYRAGNPLDVFYDLELTELVEPTIVRTSTKTIPAPVWNFKKYVTRKGDTLVHISRLAYGTNYPHFGTQIRARNKVVIYPHGVRKPLRDSKGKKNPKTTSSLLPKQHLIIPQAPNSPR